MGSARRRLTFTSIDGYSDSTLRTSHGLRALKRLRAVKGCHIRTLHGDRCLYVLLTVRYNVAASWTWRTMQDAEQRGSRVFWIEVDVAAYERFHCDLRTVQIEFARHVEATRLSVCA